MSVKNIVKVMNFHALLRVNTARNKVENAYLYERELRYVISSIINNRIFNQEKKILNMNPKGIELNIYIGSDFGFCSSFNSSVTKYLKNDKEKNDKIIIGKKINIDIKNKLLFVEKEEFNNKFNDIYNVMFEGIMKNKYSKINIIYIHYYNMGKQEILKRAILPINLEDDDFYKEKIETKTKEDFAIEGDLEYIILNLLVLYASSEIKVAEAWSWASENVLRQTFTNESLKKITEKEELDEMTERKKNKTTSFKTIIEMNNRKNRTNKEE